MVQRLKALLMWFWRIASRPSAHLSLGFLALGGFVCGVLFWGAFNTALEVTNTEKFCTSCHEMRSNVFEELQHTAHFSNRSGVRATCPDCHVPHDWTDKIARKMQASKEVWGKIFGTIDTRQKFQAHRLELAKNEWVRMKANDSLECRNCHSAVAMDFTKQTRRAADIHAKFLVTGEKTCIDCHKGIAHELPDMTGIEPGWRAPPEQRDRQSGLHDASKALARYLHSVGGGKMSAIETPRLQVER
ncbi:cytochrome c-type protein NapC [Bradyrhizobium sp. LB1.3]